MNIRSWFGFHGEYDPKLDINSCVDEILGLYADAIKKYFSIYDADNYRTILDINPSSLTKDQLIFRNWLKEKGFPFLVDFAASNLPNDQQLISKIEYDKYILEEEMDFKYPDDVRSCLIGIVNDLPEYIKTAKEISVSVQTSDIIQDRVKWGPYFQDLEPVFSIKTHYKIKGNEGLTKNYKESAQVAGSLF